MMNQLPSRNLDVDHDAKYAVRSVQALCFFCFAIGLVVAPLVGRVVQSAQVHLWADFLIWSGVLGLLIATLCYAVWRHLRMIMYRG